LRALVGYGWPGIVRELENVIERAVVLATSPLIGPDLLPDGVVDRPAWAATPLPGFEASTSAASSSPCWSRPMGARPKPRTASRFPSPRKQKIKRHGIDVRKLRDQDKQEAAG